MSDIDTRLWKLTGEINDAGWLVSGLHQIDNDHWMASVRKRNHFTSGQGHGLDPVAALADAWVNRKKPEPDRQALHDPIMEKPERVKRERARADDDAPRKIERARADERPRIKRIRA